MPITKSFLTLAIVASGLVTQTRAQTAPSPVAIETKLDTPQVHVIVATLRPHAPVNARMGHATHRVLIYLDSGTMTSKIGDEKVQTIEFHRGDVRWRPASGPYVAENTSDHPIRILEVDLKSATPGPAVASKLDPVKVDAKHYKVEFENELVRVLRVHYDAHDKGQEHEHLLNRVVLYLNDQTGAKADEVRVNGPGTHTEQNTGDQGADRIAVEIK
jgi:uncharacterized RmlC-like cupin family protein